MPVRFDQCDSLNQFFEEYGATLAEKAERKLNPLHIPGRDPIPFVWDKKYPKGMFARLPYEPQAHVITASVKALDYQNLVWIIGEMGTGKTLMGMCAAHAHARGRPYRGLVVCPDHLINKWNREIEATIPNAIVTRIRHWTEVLNLVPETVPFKFNVWPEAEGPEWTIIGRDKLKLGPGWDAAVRNKQVIDPTSRRRGYVLQCPTCGQVIRKRDGDPLSLDKLPKTRRALRCTNMIEKLTGVGDEPPTWKLVECGATLWSYNGGRFWRWAPERVIATKLRGYFDYLVMDEVHEYKASDTAQANAIGAVAEACKRAIALTGTLIGGYATHIFPLTFRLSPRSLVEEGFRWGETIRFCEEYGKLDRVIKEGKKESRKRSNKNSRGESGEITTKPAPGILPQLYGRHIMGKAVFLGLAEMASGLPPLDEGTVQCQMDDEQAEAMEEINQTLVPIACEMAAQGNIRLLGQMLEVLLYYPDHPWGWGEIGYLDEAGGYVPIMTPKTLGEETIRPKEREVIKYVGEQRKAGNQVWIYIQRNGDRDVLARLERIMLHAGFHCKTLRSSVDRDRREEWIIAQGRDVDVMISHPQLVETGLDLFGDRKKKGHNYNSLYFYQTGYRTFTLMQAARRAWRLAQWKKCQVRYSYYGGTAQQGALNLMGRKLKATLALQGQYSDEGLAAMCGDGADVYSLAKMLTDITEDTGRIWEQVAHQMGDSFGQDWEETAEAHRDQPAGHSLSQDSIAAMRAKLGLAPAVIMQPAVKFDVAARIEELRRSKKCP